MNPRRLALIPLILFALTLPALAQSSVNIRISTNPPGARYTVDGQEFVTASSFLWPRGSKHTVSVITTNITSPGGSVVCDETVSSGSLQYEPTCGVRYSFTGWQLEGTTLPAAASQTQIITVDGSFSAIVATFQAEYRVSVALMAGSSPSADCFRKASRPAAPPQAGESVGVVFVGSNCLDYAATLWLPAGVYPLQAIPMTGYAFDGWSLDGAIFPSLTSYTVRNPAVLIPRFRAAKRVRLQTDPPELKVRVDRTEIFTRHPSDNQPVYPTPAVYDWIPGTPHILGAPSPQLDRHSGKMHVFHSWSNGGGQDMVYTPDSEVGVPVTLTARFVPGVAATFLTEPRGLRLRIDGRENWPAYQFAWGLGSKYSIAAPSEQTDLNGRKWTFKEWKHGGPAAQEVNIDDAAVATGGLYFIAVYEAVPQLVLRSSLPGIMLRIDGAPCASPCMLDRPLGTQIRVAVPERVAVNEVNRHEFAGWSDGGQAERVVSFDRLTQELRANYQQAYRLITAVDPADGATLTAAPASADGFYPAGTPVALSIEAKPGFRFRRWDGDIAGTNPEGVVALDAPRTVQALLTKIPLEPSATVRNAAGLTPVEGVAPGSLISVVGTGLGTATQAGPANPLAQSIAGVAITLGDRILPLVFASPEQINALLPSDLLPGEYRLSVRPADGPPVHATFAAVRHAPGLLTTTTETGPQAVATHEDGSPLTVSSPARTGDIVTLLGTGFGPYDRQPVDGFAVPSSPRYTLVDPVTVRIGDLTVRPEWAGAAPGLTGVVAVRFRIPTTARGVQNVLVTANGVESNTVPLPVE